jgi:hypothetical protein
VAREGSNGSQKNNVSQKRTSDDARLQESKGNEHDDTLGIPLKLVGEKEGSVGGKPKARKQLLLIESV